MNSEERDIRQTDIPAVGETDLDDTDAASETNHDSVETERTYQDDLDYKDTDVDPVINEATESPADELGIPEQEFKEELDKYVDDDTGTGDDDMRETIEDRDENDANAASSSQ